MAQLICQSCGKPFWASRSDAIICRVCKKISRKDYHKDYSIKNKEKLSAYSKEYMRVRRDGDKCDIVKCDKQCFTCKFQDCIEPIKDEDTLPLWGAEYD